MLTPDKQTAEQFTGFSELGEIIDQHGGLIQTGPFGSQLKQSEYAETGIPVVMPKDISSGRIDTSSIARVPEEKAESLARHSLKIGSIIFPRRGDIGKCAIIKDDNEGFLCGTGCIKIELPADRLDSVFLYYYLTQPVVTGWLERNAIGSTMLNLNTKIIARLPIPDLELNHQKRIADVLQIYDDLIENNRRRIQLLEESARLIYKEWFVHLRFPGRENVDVVDGVPDGWEKQALGNILTLNYGKALKADSRVSGQFPVYGSSGIVGQHNKALTEGPAIVIGRKGNVGSVYWVSSDFHPIDTVYFINKGSSNLYLFFALQFVKFINTDVAVPGLNRNVAYSREILVPPKVVLDLFLKEVTPIQQQTEKLISYNKKLAEARDLLLPKLMNGELTV